MQHIAIESMLRQCTPITASVVSQVDKYAPETEVHKYLHSRLASFDIATLYELHYQMITLGKVRPPFSAHDKPRS